MALCEDYSSGNGLVYSWDEKDIANPDNKNIAAIIEFKSSPNGYTKYLLTNHTHIWSLKFKPGRMRLLRPANQPGVTATVSITDATFAMKRKPYPIIPTRAQMMEAMGALSE